MKRFSPGFSLLELLVVISIIGILVAVTAASFTTAQRTSRDARRRADLKAMQNAAEQFYSAPGNNNQYPASTAQMLPYFSGGSLPQDPQGNPTYTYTVVGTGYCLSTRALEVPNSGTCGANCAAGNTHFCLRNLQ